jgi:hypothetical protein
MAGLMKLLVLYNFRSSMNLYLSVFQNVNIVFLEWIIMVYIFPMISLNYAGPNVLFLTALFRI